MKRILLVEDDPNLGFVIKDALQYRGYEVTLISDGLEAEKQISQETFDLILLDVMLPGTDGLTLSKSIRTINPSVPVLLLTAKSMIDDKLEGFRSGADDYITKPFHMDELMYRMEVFFKRSKVAGHQQQFSIGKYEFNYQSLLLKIEHQQKSLTQREADVLRLLCLEKDRVIKREEILKTVWGDDDYFMGRSLDVFISKLRKYLKEDPSVEIVNYHGIGFKLQFN